MDDQLCSHNSQNKSTKANMNKSSNEQMKGSRPSVGNSRGKDKNARPPVERPSGGRPPARGTANGTKWFLSIFDFILFDYVFIMNKVNVNKTSTNLLVHFAFLFFAFKKTFLI